MTDLVVGCPVSHRSWILDAWFDYIERACSLVQIQPTYAFVVDERDPCVEIIRRRAKDHVLTFEPDTRGADQRDWRPVRFQRMVELRNRLLGLVREVAPTHFLSVDSDILVHPFLVRDLRDDLTLDLWDAVGSKVYLSLAGRKCPNYASLTKVGGLHRPESSGYFEAKIIMALKMMTPAAYGVDYEFHAQGEDTGWSLACAAKGLQFAWDGRICSKHVMAPHMLDRVDPRVGF